jgi:UDP-glucose 4-epimerase
MKQQILVTGGMGYIGSHTIVDLLENGFDVISADNLVNADICTLKGIEKITGKKVKNYKTDLCDLKKTRKIFVENPNIAGIIHFAALKSVEFSMKQPTEYFKNNIESLLNILLCMEEFNVKNLIFSSSCTVYGNPDQLPVTEETPMKPAESPYGRTKQIGEYILEDFARRFTDKNVILLRYFNPAGAHPTALIGEKSTGYVTTLVPLINEVAVGKRAQLTVYGNDYPTRDGSCLRDFIHVSDLANAHTKALTYTLQGKNASNCEVFNLGIGEGVTVLEAINAFEKVTGRKLNWQLGARRAGDVMAIYSVNTKAVQQLGWQPKYGIEEIMRSSWAWEMVLSAMA